jgi:hypothetical protein
MSEFDDSTQHCVVDVSEVIVDDTTGTSEHFSKSIWKNLAEIAPAVKSVIMMLSTVNIIGGNISWSTSDVKNVVYMGQQYDEIFAPVTSKVEKKSSGKKHEAKNTGEKIRRENEIKRITESFCKISDFFDKLKKTTWDYKNFPSGVKLSAEHLAKFFILAIQYTKATKTSEENIYTLIHAILKFCDSVDETQINNSIFLTLKNDFEDFKRHVNFMPEKFITVHSKLTVFNSFDHIFEGSSGFRPMDHQKVIIQQIASNFRHGFLLKYKVLAGYGKTTSIVPISVISKLLGKNNRVVFCCNIDSVRQEVAKLLLHTGITFGIVAHTYWKKDERDWYIKKHPSCKEEDEELQVLITGPEFANSVIQKLEENDKEVILFLDDFTVNADEINSANLKYNADIFSNPPKRIILSSATLPDDDKIQDVFTIYKHKYPQGNIDILPITCDKIKIGCDLFTLYQHPITPFTGATSISELSQISACILSNPFLKKFCTFSRLKEYNIEFAKKSFEKFKISEFSAKYENLNANSIAKFLVDSLMSVKEYDDVTNDEISDMFAKKGGADEINFDGLLSDWTTMFPGMTLIATPDPKDFLNNFNRHLEKVRSNFNLRKEIEIFNKKVENYEKLMEQKEKAEASSKEKKIVRDENGKAEVHTQEGCADAFSGIERPVFKFPNFLKINSKEHCDSICGKSEIPCEHQNNHREFFPDGEDCVDGIRLIDLNIDEDLILLLMCGIGVWSKTITSPQYRSIILRCASANMLAYVIADETICFGTNYPFNRVIVTKEFSAIHSIETILQVIARAGRLGLIYKAEAFIPDSLLPRLKDYSMTNIDSTFDEGRNISCVTRDLYFKKKASKFAETIKLRENEYNKIFEKKNALFNSEKDTFIPRFVKNTLPIQPQQSADEWETIFSEIAVEIDKELPQQSLITKPISQVKPKTQDEQNNTNWRNNSIIVQSQQRNQETSQSQTPVLDRQIFGSSIVSVNPAPATVSTGSAQTKQKYVPPSRRQ